MNPDLLRQRRNLILMSMTLLIFDFASVKIGKVSVLGTELIIGNANVLMWCAWLLWAYFLLRYYQYWRAEEGSPIRTAYAGKLHSLSKGFQRTDPFKEKFPDYIGMYLVLKRKSILDYVLAIDSGYLVRNPPPGGIVCRVGNLRLMRWQIRAMGHVLFHTHRATDHILPFTLAAAALVLNLQTLAQSHDLFGRLQGWLSALRDCSAYLP